jgi:hypothetical protein
MRKINTLTILAILTILVILIGCASPNDEVNKVNAQLYIPMLKEYIGKDNILDNRLKDTYYYSLDLWYRSLKNEL